MKKILSTIPASLGGGFFLTILLYAPVSALICWLTTGEGVINCIEYNILFPRLLIVGIIIAFVYFYKKGVDSAN